MGTIAMPQNNVWAAYGLELKKNSQKLFGGSSSHSKFNLNLFWQKIQMEQCQHLDLEMMGLLLEWLVLEIFADLAYKHIACWSNNTPTIA